MEIPITETEIRLAAFDWLKERILLRGETLTRRELESEFTFHGERVTLIGAAGIWKPRQFETIPISIASTVEGPYDDTFSEDGLLVYRYRGSDPNHRDNVGLREAMRTRTPLIYFFGIVPGRYIPVWPVFIIENHPENLLCLAAVDPAYAFQGDESVRDVILDDGRSESTLSIRRYVTTFTRRRLHQTSFRPNFSER